MVELCIIGKNKKKIADLPATHRYCTTNSHRKPTTPRARVLLIVYTRRYPNFTYKTNRCSPPTRHARALGLLSRLPLPVARSVTVVAAYVYMAMSAKLAPYRRRRRDLGWTNYSVVAGRRRWIEVPCIGTLDIWTVCPKVTTNRTTANIFVHTCFIIPLSHINLRVS